MSRGTTPADSSLTCEEGVNLHAIEQITRKDLDVTDSDIHVVERQILRKARWDGLAAGRLSPRSR